jgi:hypothetical protein
MLAAEAQVKTDDPDRYLIQLRRHAQQAHRLRHRPGDHGGDGQPPPKVQHVACSETSGTIRFGWGQCTMQATPGTLTLRAEAADEESLQRVQNIIARNIERFGKRHQLTVTWQRAPAPSPARPASQTAPRPTELPRHTESRRCGAGAQSRTSRRPGRAWMQMAGHCTVRLLRAARQGMGALTRRPER